MTIAIGVAGPKAGLAAFTALKMAERVAQGSIGGFVTFAALSEDGQLLRFDTQRGGASTLFTLGEQTGVEPPEEVATAVAAALIASGPNRPEPLSQFVPGDAAVGLVTGHRLPQSIGVDGRPLNRAALENLAAGQAPDLAIKSVLDANPNADAGLIAINRAGRVASYNSARVRARHDVGQERRENAAVNAEVEVLQNSIKPCPSVAALAADWAMAVMVGEPAVDGTITIRAGTMVELGESPLIEVDGEGIATRLVTTDAQVLAGHHICAPIYAGSPIRQGDKELGRSLLEPITELVDGRITSLIGRDTMRVGYTNDPL